MLNIYFAGSIRGGREDADVYARLISFLKNRGRVLTEHVGDASLLGKEKLLTEGEIFTRDMEWLEAADLVVAEVSTPSLGVGYEIGLAQSMGKRVFCLYRKTADKRLSAMIAGNPFLQIVCYTNGLEAQKLLDDWLAECLPDKISLGHAEVTRGG